PRGGRRSCGHSAGTVTTTGVVSGRARRVTSTHDPSVPVLLGVSGQEQQFARGAPPLQVLVGLPGVGQRVTPTDTDVELPFRQSVEHLTDPPLQFLSGARVVAGLRTGQKQ